MQNHLIKKIGHAKQCWLNTVWTHTHSGIHHRIVHCPEHSSNNHAANVHVSSGSNQFEVSNIRCVHFGWGFSFEAMQLLEC